MGVDMGVKNRSVRGNARGILTPVVRDHRRINIWGNTSTEGVKYSTIFIYMYLVICRYSMHIYRHTQIIHTPICVIVIQYMPMGGARAHRPERVMERVPGIGEKIPGLGGDRGVPGVHIFFAVHVN